MVFLIFLGVKKGQISTEYVIVLAFVLFLIAGLLGIAFFYAAEIKDALRLNQLERFAKKVTTTAESVFYAGEPSKTSITAYLPDGVYAVDVALNDLIFTVTTRSGVAKIAYSSSVALTGNISAGGGVKKIVISALQNRVNVTSV